MRNKKLKLEFLKHFSKQDWLMFKNYPRLFTIYSTFNDFSLMDLRRWYKKFNCNSDNFSLIVKTLHTRICFEKYNNDFPNDYENLAKYDFKYFMDNIHELIYKERMPRYTYGSIKMYLKNSNKYSILQGDY